MTRDRQFAVNDRVRVCITRGESSPYAQDEYWWGIVRGFSADGKRIRVQLDENKTVQAFDVKRIDRG